MPKQRRKGVATNVGEALRRDMQEPCVMRCGPVIVTSAPLSPEWLTQYLQPTHSAYSPAHARTRHHPGHATSRSQFRVHQKVGRNLNHTERIWTRKSRQILNNEKGFSKSTQAIKRNYTPKAKRSNKQRGANTKPARVTRWYHVRAPPPHPTSSSPSLLITTKLSSSTLSPRPTHSGA